MRMIKLDTNMTSQFAGSKHQTLICDEHGNPLGFFLPPEVFKKLVYRDVEVPFSEEELELRSRATGGCSLQEMWARLENRVASEEKA